MSLFARLRCAVILALFLACPIVPIEAQYTELEELHHSKEYEQFLLRLGERRSQIGGTRNIDLIFGPHRGYEIENLMTWIGTPGKGFRPSKPGYKANIDIAAATRLYLIGDTMQSLTVTIVVPSPTIADAAASGFIDELNGFHPPVLKVTSEEHLNVADLPATFYFQKDGAVSLLFRSPQHALVQIRAKDIRNREALFRLAEALSIKRLFEKLAY